MTDKELRHLNRRELLELLLMQSKKIDALEAELDAANAKLREKSIQINESGSIAEASLRVSNIFTDAQNAAEQYLENVNTLKAQTEIECRRAMDKARSDAEKYYRSAVRIVDSYIIDLTDRLKSVIDESFDRSQVLKLIREENNEK